MVTIGLFQSFTDRILLKHKFWDNINKLYKTAVKYDYFHLFKWVVESDTVSTTKFIIDNIPRSVELSETTNKLNSIKTLRQFSALFDVNHKSAIWRLCCASMKLRENNKGIAFWYNIKKHKCYTKINASVNIIYIIGFYTMHMLWIYK